MKSNTPKASLSTTKKVYKTISEAALSAASESLDIRKVIRSPVEIPDFVLPGLVSGTVAVIVGPGGVSKSMLALQTAAVIANGRDHWSLWSDQGSVPQGRVVLLNIEDPMNMIGMRVHHIGRSIETSLREDFTDNFADNVDIRSLSGLGFEFAVKNPKTGYISASEWMEWMEDRLQGCRLAILDTFIRGLNGLDENSSTDIAKVLDLLGGIARRTGCAIMFLHHVNKGSSGKDGSASAQQAARGSSAITDNARWQSNLSTMSEAEAAARGLNEDRKRWVSVDLSKVNYAPPMESRWLYRGDGGVLNGESQPPALIEDRVGKKAGGRRNNVHSFRPDAIDLAIPDDLRNSGRHSVDD